VQQTFHIAAVLGSSARTEDRRARRSMFGPKPSEICTPRLEGGRSGDEFHALA
jgi:hypothetical protein